MIDKWWFGEVFYEVLIDRWWMIDKWWFGEVVYEVEEAGTTSKTMKLYEPN